MTTYTIKPEYTGELCNDIESESHVYSLEEIMTDAENFRIPLAEYIVKYLDVHQDNPVEAD